MQIRQVQDYHSYMRNKGVNMVMMGFYKESKQNGHSGDLYKRGYVVSGYAGSDSHRYFGNKQMATAFAMSRLASENRE